MEAKELVARVQREANQIMGVHAKNARLGGNHKYAPGPMNSRRLAAVVLRSRRNSALRRNGTI